MDMVFYHKTMRGKMKPVTWTGDNIEEMNNLSFKANFGFFRGSNYYNRKWYHKLYDKVASKFEYLPEWEPPDDPYVLEIYFIGPTTDNYWTTMRIEDSIDQNGVITRGTGKDKT